MHLNLIRIAIVMLMTNTRRHRDITVTILQSVVREELPSSWPVVTGLVELNSSVLTHKLNLSCLSQT